MAIWLSLLLIMLSFYVMTEVVDKRFVQSLDNIAHWLKLPSDVAGATLLALGTSAPEISTALIALFLENANPATGVGTIVGSAIFQILVVIGFAAVIRTCYLSWKIVLRDALVYAISVGLLLLFIRDDRFVLWEAIVLVVAYLGYIVLLFFWMRYVKTDEPDDHRPIQEVEKEITQELKRKTFIQRLRTIITYPVDLVILIIPNPEKRPLWTVPVFFISLGIIAYSCYWLVLAAESLALVLGIPPAIIALTILAGGTSIPEMISSAIVARQGRGNMAIANAIGSNTFDILMSLGLPVLIFILWKGHSISGLGGSDIFNSILLLFWTLALFIVMLIITRFKVTRVFGGILLTLYVVYVWAAYAGWMGG